MKADVAPLRLGDPPSHATDNSGFQSPRPRQLHHIVGRGPLLCDGEYVRCPSVEGGALLGRPVVAPSAAQSQTAQPGRLTDAVGDHGAVSQFKIKSGADQISTAMLAGAPVFEPGQLTQEKPFEHIR